MRSKACIALESLHSKFDEATHNSHFLDLPVRQMGFRFRSSRNPTTRSVSRSKRREGDMKSFYLALSYVKLYRIQPEPEFVYLSDARIPPKVLDRQVRHDIHQLTPVESLSTEEGGVQIFDDKALQRISSDRMARSPEETYYKYRGEQVLLNSVSSSKLA